MWTMIGLFVCAALISIFELPPLVKKKWWREIFTFFILLSAGLTLSILLSKNVTIPTPLDLITNMYRPITIFIERILS
jgi:hypothetical protein